MDDDMRRLKVARAYVRRLIDSGTVKPGANLQALRRYWADLDLAIADLIEQRQ
jgi:hypothetical protein